MRSGTGIPTSPKDAQSAGRQSVPSLSQPEFAMLRCGTWDAGDAEELGWGSGEEASRAHGCSHLRYGGEVSGASWQKRRVNSAKACE